MSNPRSPNRAIRTVSSRLGKPWEGLPFRIGPVAKSDVERVPGAGEATRTVPSPERTARGRSSTFSRSRRVASRRWLVFRKRITARQPPSGEKVLPFGRASQEFSRMLNGLQGLYWAREGFFLAGRSKGEGVG